MAADGRLREKIRQTVPDWNLTYSMSVTEALNWIPDNISSYTVFKMQAVSRLCRPFIRSDYDPIQFKERDWDNLIILDACRYDTFEKLHTFDQEPQKVYSNASHTAEFLQQNFSGEHKDTVYVSASPQLAGYEDTFHHLEHVWEDGWDEEYNTVLPETMTDRALDLYEENTDKRMVIHFMQPHWPFIGDKGRDIRGQGTYMKEREKASPWELLYSGNISKEKIVQAYEENLQQALPAVERLADELSGKTAVTSDHGNLFGERVSFLPFKIYGHPPKTHYSGLTAVPWLELPYDERRTITADSSTEQESTEDEEVKKKLADLGYV